MRLNRPFRVFDPVGPCRVPYLTKHKKVSKTATKSFVFAMVWEAFETFGFRHILERLAGLNRRVPLNQPFRVWEAEWV